MGDKLYSIIWPIEYILEHQPPEIHAHAIREQKGIRLETTQIFLKLMTLQTLAFSLFSIFLFPQQKMQPLYYKEIAVDFVTI